MLSNRKWFLFYSRLRIIIIGAFILVPFSKLFRSVYSEYEAIWNVLLIILGALLITLLLFDYLQKPSFLELEKVEKGIVFKLYKPDTRNFFYLKESAIRFQLIADGDLLTYRIYKKPIPVFNQIEFFIKKKNDPTIKTDKINIGWMSEEQMIELNHVIKSQA